LVELYTPPGKAVWPRKSCEKEKCSIRKKRLAQEKRRNPGENLSRKGKKGSQQWEGRRGKGEKMSIERRLRGTNNEGEKVAMGRPYLLFARGSSTILKSQPRKRRKGNGTSEGKHEARRRREAYGKKKKGVIPKPHEGIMFCEKGEKGGGLKREPKDN